MACWVPDHCPWLELLFELEAATMITSAAQKSFELFSDSQMGKGGALEDTHSSGVRDSTV